MLIINASSVDLFNENNVVSNDLNISVSNQVVNEYVQLTNTQNYTDDETVQSIQKIADDNELSKNQPERESDDFTMWRRRLVRAVGQYLIENARNEIPSKQQKTKIC